MPFIASSSSPVLNDASNFRDIGGRYGIDGRRVRAGQVFRSDHLAGLTPDDHGALQPLGITHSIDFRGVAERAALPSTLPGTTAIALAIEPTVMVRVQALLARGQVPTEADAVELMCQTYRGFVREAAPTYARFFATCWSNPRRWCSTAPPARTAPVSPPRCCSARSACSARP